MPELKNKTILIISPQSWGKMFVSKHHYALELAKYGNTVYFLNPPDETMKERVLITPLAATSSLYIIDHRINFPYNIKFHAIGIFHWLMQWQVKKILQAIGKPIDIVWSFDLGNLYPFRFFPKRSFRIFHPVDEPLNPTAIASAKDAQVIFSVTNEILEKYKNYGLPLHFINHGVSDFFFVKEPVTRTGSNIRVGFSGNLLRTDIDRPIFLQIIKENPSVIFECWGSYQLKDANIGGGLNNETNIFINDLRSSANVILHGAVTAEELAIGYQHMDAFLICYDINKDQSSGTNYHKVMEYLSIGKAIISNNISTYQNEPELVYMVSQRDDNHLLPELFKKTITNLSVINNDAAIMYRKSFARMNTYEKQIKKIEALIYKN